MGMGMGWYKRLIFDGFRHFNWKSRAVGSFPSRSRYKTGRSTIFQPVFRNSVWNHVLKNNNSQIKNPNFVAKRFYSEFQAMRCRQRRWYQNPWNLGFVGFGVIVYYRNLETVPYTKRRRFVIVSSSLEKKIAKFFESFLLEFFKGKILASDHPDSIRVERVGRKIIEGMRKGFRRLGDDEDRDRLIKLLDEYNWEFIVVDDPTINNARCCFAGKIIIFTGRLQHHQNDFEIAVDISHEVGHAVARHNAENMSSIIFWILSLFPTYENKDHSGHFLWDPISRRHESEADYIGFLINASAGYDPRKMLEACKKLYHELDKLEDLEGCSSHPSGKTRLEQVSQAKVLEEALAMYKEALKDKDKDKESVVTLIFQKIIGSVF